MSPTQVEQQKTTGELLLRLGLRFEEGMKTVSTNKKCIENLFLVFKMKSIDTPMSV
jgi:hypothetical protein